MNIMNLPAKSNGETIRQHTDKLLEDFRKFKNLYGKFFSDIQLKAIEIACEYHDYGKASFNFQKNIGNEEFISRMKSEKLYNEIINMYSEVYCDAGIESKRIFPHGYLSCAFMNKDKIMAELSECNPDLSMIYMAIIITAIYNHHNRRISVKTNNIKKIICGDLQKVYPDVKTSAWYRTKVLGDTFFKGDLRDINWVNYALVIGMLNKFDYHASSENYQKTDAEISPADSEGKYICDKIDDYFKLKNYEYRDIQKYASAHSDENIVIVASTGIGKTEAALLWAGKNKIFYTLPLKVSINAMYSRILKEYKYSEEKTALLHSDVFSYLSDEENDNIDKLMLKYESSGRLSYPLTVCTIDQLFTFVYKYRGCEQIFAALKYSKLIIDEIQSYEPELIAKIIYGLKLITLAGGKFAVITATFPSVFRYFMATPKYFSDFKPIEFVPEERFLITDKMRHKIHYEKCDFDYDEIACKSENKKILVICNTVKKACEVYKNLKEYVDNVNLIHSNFIRSDRRILENEIMNFSNDKSASGIWVSTQIVEASLDIDFDILFTEMCTADSLLQRMGRCYRKRDYSGETEPNVYIIDNENGLKTVYKYTDIYERSVEFLKKYNDDFFSETDKMDYIDKVYNVDEIKSSAYFKDIEKTLKICSERLPFVYESKDAKHEFRNIVSYSVIPQSIYDRYTSEFEKNIDILKSSGRNKSQKEKTELFNQKLQARKFIEDNSVQISGFDKRRKSMSNSLFQGLDYYTVKYEYHFSDDDKIGLTHDFDTDADFL